MGKRISTDELIWPLFNKTGKDITLYEHENPVPHVIGPGERMVLPKQRQVLREMFEYDMILYGGAGGGGKSRLDAMIHPYFHIWFNIEYQKFYADEIANGTMNKHHQLDTAMFAETRPDLYNRQVTNIPKLYPEWLGEWYESKYEYRFYKKWGGGAIKYLGLERPERFRSLELAGATVDESTQVGDKEVVMQVKSRLRCPVMTPMGYQPFMVLTSNPGGPGHAWHKEDFVDEATRVRPSKSERFTDAQGNPIIRRGNRFIPCLPTENPFLDPNWYADLEIYPASIRDAMLYGKWDAYEGMYYSSLTSQVHYKEWFQVPDEWPKFRGLDPGGNDPLAVVWVALAPKDEEHPNGFGVAYREYEQISNDLYFHKQNISDLSRGDKTMMWTVGGKDLFRDNNLSVRSKESNLQILNTNDAYGPAMNVVCCDDRRDEGWMALSRAFSYEGEWTETNGFRNLSVTRAPMLYILDNCPLLWNEIKNLEVNLKKPNDVLPRPAGKIGQGDHLPDALRYVWMQMGISVPKTNPLKKTNWRDLMPNRAKPRSSKNNRRGTPLSRI